MGSTFDNNLVKNAISNLTPEQLEKYQEMGNSLYKTIDFVKGIVLNNVDPPTEEKLSYIIAGIKSGLLPKDLEKDEIELMIEYYGEKWYEKYGFTDKDIDNKKNKQILIQNEKFKKCGRNDKCPCNSGKKFKICHGKGNKNFKEKNINPIVNKTLSTFRNQYT